jgi:biuret amidohydrolase
MTIKNEDLEMLRSGKFGILVIDVHSGHIGDNATIPVPNGGRIIKPLENLLREARALEVPIIQVVHQSRRNGIEIRSSPFWNSANYSNSYRRMPEHNVGRATLLLPIQTGDYEVATKRRYSAFYGTDLEILLRSLNVDSVILTGLTTDCCVLNTAFECFNRDLKVILLDDCTESDSSEDKAAAFRIVSRLLGWVTNSEEVLKLVRSANKAGV